MLSNAWCRARGARAGVQPPPPGAVEAEGRSCLRQQNSGELLRSMRSLAALRDAELGYDCRTMTRDVVRFLPQISAQADQLHYPRSHPATAGAVALHLDLAGPQFDALRLHFPRVVTVSPTSPSSPMGWLVAVPSDECWS